MKAIKSQSSMANSHCGVWLVSYTIMMFSLLNVICCSCGPFVDTMLSSVLKSQNDEQTAKSVSFTKFSVRCLPEKVQDYFSIPADYCVFCFLSTVIGSIYLFVFCWVFLFRHNKHVYWLQVYILVTHPFIDISRGLPNSYPSMYLLPCPANGNTHYHMHRVWFAIYMYNR